MNEQNDQRNWKDFSGYPPLIDEDEVELEEYIEDKKKEENEIISKTTTPRSS